MDAIALETMDARVEAECASRVRLLRQLADALEWCGSGAESIEALMCLAGPIDELARRADFLLPCLSDPAMVPTTTARAKGKRK